MLLNRSSWANIMFFSELNLYNYQDNPKTTCQHLVIVENEAETSSTNPTSTLPFSLIAMHITQISNN